MASSVLDPSSLPQTVSATMSPLILAEPQNSSVGGQELNLLEGLPRLQPLVTQAKGFLRCNWYSLTTAAALWLRNPAPDLTVPLRAHRALETALTCRL